MSTRKTAKKDSLEVEVFDDLQQSAMMTAREGYSCLAPHKLTVSQFGTLRTLYNHGPMCQRDICDNILKTTGNMTIVIDNLEKRSLVRRLPRDGNDRRYNRIELTTEGKQLIKKILPQLTRAIKQVMERLPKKDQEQLKRICCELSCLCTTKKQGGT